MIIDIQMNNEKFYDLCYSSINIQKDKVDDKTG